MSALRVCVCRAVPVCPCTRSLEFSLSGTLFSRSRSTLSLSLISPSFPVFCFSCERGPRGPRAVLKFHLCVRRSGVLGVEMKTLPVKRRSGVLGVEMKTLPVKSYYSWMDTTADARCLVAALSCGSDSRRSRASWGFENSIVLWRSWTRLPPALAAVCCTAGAMVVAAALLVAHPSEMTLRW